MPGPLGVEASTLCFWLEQRPVKTLYLLWFTKFNAKAEGDASDRSALYS
jgi:hypothetical protein